MASPENVCYEWFELAERQKEQGKGAHVRIAGMVWTLSGFYLYGTRSGVSLFSLSALGFFIVGIFLTSTVIGSGVYVVRRKIADALIKTEVFLDPKTVITISALGYLLLVAEIVLSYEFAKAAFGRITAM